MPDEIILRPIGRVSEPGHSVAPKGSLLRAKNCTMRRPGALAELPEPVTFGFGPSAAAGGYHQSPQFDNGSTPGQLVWYADPGTSQVGVESVIGGSPLTYEDVDGSSRAVEYFETPNSFRQYVTYPFWIARSNMYLADQRGAYKWSSTDDTSLESIRDAVLHIEADYVAGTNEWLPVDDRVAYAAAAVYRDSNDVVRVSSPFFASSSKNGTASPKAVDVTVFIDQGSVTVTFDSVYLYRTRTFDENVTLPNEFYLASRIPASDFVAQNDGSYATTHRDEISADDLGASLYTNSSLDGATSANVAPPSGLYHSSFRGHEFWGDVAEKEVFEPLRFTGSSLSDLKHTMTGVDASIGSDQLTVTALNGAEVGMVIESVSGGFTTEWITDISGAGPFTVTISSNSAVNLSGASLDAFDTVYVRHADGSSTRIGLGHEGIAVAPVIATGPGAVGGTIDVVDVSGTYFGDAVTPYLFEVVFGTVIRTARQGPSQLWVSNPENFADFEWADLDTGTGSPTSGGTPALPALHRRRIYFSKHQEPEHTTLLSFEDVGGSGNIVGLGALRDALIILKEEGVYRLTGNNGNWRIDPLDTSVRILGGRSTQVMDNAVYTLSDRGLLRITSTGVENLTQNVISDWFRDGEKIGAVSRYMQSHEGYTPMGLFAAADESNREYVLHCEGGDASGLGFDDTELLVFNAATGAFTTWELHEGSTLPVASIGYVRGWYESAVEQVPGVIYSRPFSTGPTNASMALIDNRQGSKPSAYWDQELAFRGIHIGDPTHIKQWIELVWDFDSVDEGAPVDVDALYATHEAEAIQTGFQTQTIGAVSKQELRLWPPRSAVARSTKPVFGLRGRGLRVFGMRATYRSSGRKSPL